jgi:two-component system, NtrC family, response regulator AtoC
MTQQDVLIVDDEPQMLIAMNETVKRAGFSVATAGSGVEALERMKGCHYRMVITDLRMPVVSGLEVLKEVKYRSPRTQVILVTAHGTVNNAVEAMKLGAFDYLLKPFSAENLRSVVQRAIQKNESFLTVRKAQSPFPIVTQDPDMRAALELAEQAARGKATILIQAESGTGKELVARSIHQLSPRKDGPFVAVNCAALPDHLLEAELFGHEKGAFTGAIAQKLGKFELANHGTLLLDEIGEMVPLLQAKLLRVLQEKEIDRVGGKNPIPVDVRVIATTNKDLKTLVQNGTFREDLYYRLNVIPLGIPPLRKRRNDVGLLADYFCEKYGMETHNRKMVLAAETHELLMRYDWPGNVRELENVMQRATSLAASAVIYPKELLLYDAFRRLSPQSEVPSVHASENISLPSTGGGDPDTVSRNESKGVPTGLDLKAGCSVSEMEKQLIQITLAETNGNRTHAARLLGISLRTLRNKLREYRLAEELVGVEDE